LAGILGDLDWIITIIIVIIVLATILLLMKEGVDATKITVTGALVVSLIYLIFMSYFSHFPHLRVVENNFEDSSQPMNVQGNIASSSSVRELQVLGLHLQHTVLAKVSGFISSPGLISGDSVIEHLRHSLQLRG